MSLSLSSNDVFLEIVYSFCPNSGIALQKSTDSKQVATLNVQGAPITGNKTIAVHLCSLLPHCQLLGSNNDETAEMDQWMTFAFNSLKSSLASGDKANIQDTIKFLDEHLATRTFIAGNHLSLADIALLTHLHPYVSTVTKKAVPKILNVVRYFLLIQGLVREKSSILNAVEFELDLPLEQKKEKKAKKEEKKGEDQKENKSQIDSKENKPQKENKEEKSRPATTDKAEKKNKKEKKEKEKKPAEESKQESAFPDPSMLDLRVGFIIEAKKHDQADSLYVEQIDCGEETPRTVVSGLVKYVPVEQMQKRYCVVMCNLKPANMRGVKSHAMVMCAKDPSSDTVEILDPPAGSKPGDKVFIEGYSGEPEAVLNPKKKIWESIAPDMITIDKKAAYMSRENGAAKVCYMRTEKGLCTSKTVVCGSVS